MFSGSYNSEDIQFLMEPVHIKFTGIKEKEKLIQEGKKHYSEMLSKEKLPSKKYLDLFYDSLRENKFVFCNDLYRLATKICSQADTEITLVSLARAGTPIGVILNRIIKKLFNKNCIHYSISIIRDRGIDENAILHILNKRSDKSIFFIDGWTGKGVISKELFKRIIEFNEKFKTQINPGIYVVSDLCGVAKVSASQEDYLIPCSILNSTISGLVSRSILNKELFPDSNFHNCVYFKEFEKNDISKWFVDNIFNFIKSIQKGFNLAICEDKKSDLNKISIDFIQETMKKYNVLNINYIKPGIGESTRVLLRRVPDKVLVKDKDNKDIKHLIQLAEEKNVPVLEDIHIPYKAVSIIQNLKR